MIDAIKEAVLAVIVVVGQLVLSCAVPKTEVKATIDPTKENVPVFVFETGKDRSVTCFDVTVFEYASDKPKEMWAISVNPPQSREFGPQAIRELHYGTVPPGFHEVRTAAPLQTGTDYIIWAYLPHAGNKWKFRITENQQGRRIVHIERWAG